MGGLIVRKNQLIEILKSIKGNPEVMIWNGLVEDMQPIEKEILECKLFKLSFEGYKERVNMQRAHKDNLPELPDDELKLLYKKHKVGQYEVFNYYPPDDNDKAYNKKTVFVLEPKATGKTHFDRFSTITY